MSSWTEDKGVTYNEDENENRRCRGMTKQNRRKVERKREEEDNAEKKRGVKIEADRYFRQ